MSDKSYFEYDNHAAEWDMVLSDPARKLIGDTWLRVDTLDYWRHERIRAPLKSIVKCDKSLSWLTVGDGRYGTDAHYLMSIGAQNVHCSDISDTLLRIGNQRGFIGTFSAQNAESLKFDDSSIDYIYCKESLHHFPRPYLALYEMFRVCRGAVIITEPRDQLIDGSIFSSIFFLLYALLKRKSYRHRFEPVGNYIYSVSERELAKFLLGMHYTVIAFKGCNDAYEPGVEFIPIDSRVTRHRLARTKMFTKIAMMNMLEYLCVMKSGLLTAALFKQAPSTNLVAEMKKDGWDILELPINPYRGQPKI